LSPSKQYNDIVHCLPYITFQYRAIY